MGGGIIFQEKKIENWLSYITYMTDLLRGRTLHWAVSPPQIKAFMTLFICHSGQPFHYHPMPNSTASYSGYKNQMRKYTVHSRAFKTINYFYKC